MDLIKNYKIQQLFQGSYLSTKQIIDNLYTPHVWYLGDKCIQDILNGLIITMNYLFITVKTLDKFQNILDPDLKKYFNNNNIILIIKFDDKSDRFIIESVDNVYEYIKIYKFGVESQLEILKLIMKNHFKCKKCFKKSHYKISKKKKYLPSIRSSEYQSKSIYYGHKTNSSIM